MTDIALARHTDAAPAEPFFTRRMHALFRLLRLRRRHARTTSDLHFADDRVLADVGIRRDRHRGDWLTAFLSR